MSWKGIVPILGIVCLWSTGRWLFHLPVGTMLLVAAFVIVLAMLRALWWSERAHRSVERERHEHFASEREFGRARQTERGD